MDGWKERLAWVTEHLNPHPASTYVPKYHVSLTQGRLLPPEVVIVAQGKSSLGPTRKRHNFFVLIRMSSQSSSNSHIWNNRCSSITDWVINDISSEYAIINNLLLGLHKECTLSKYIAKIVTKQPWQTPKFVTNSADQQSFHLTHA